MAGVQIYRWERHFSASTVLGIVGVGGIGFHLMAALRLTAQNQVAAILLIILACAVALYSLGTILKRRLE